jgi:hypothetical protein
MPQPGYRNDVHRAALAAALILPGLPTPIATSEAAARTHPHLLRTAIPGTLQRYLDDGHASVLAAICDIAEGLDKHGSPIHYHRRRRAITGAGLLTANQWTDMCEQAGAHPGIGRRLIDARRYLFTTPHRGRPRRSRPPARLHRQQRPNDDLRRAVQDQRGGWTRLERFATAMTYPTLSPKPPPPSASTNRR